MIPAGHGLLLADPHHGFARIHMAPPGDDLWWHFERLMLRIRIYLTIQAPL